ncbi:MAG: PadR family transcriptional regulator [Clostridia bacterium]|nr:PadR family transcriptional regulator [Clostridia bacterium]
MARTRFKTLTEQMFYILLCMKEECRGMDILETVRNMTGGRVNIGSGTLYDLLEQFVEEEIIAETRTEGRRRSYIITEKGKAMLAGEYERLRRQTADYNMIFGGEQNK